MGGGHAGEKMFCVHELNFQLSEMQNKKQTHGDNQSARRLQESFWYLAASARVVFRPIPLEAVMGRFFVLPV